MSYDFVEIGTSDFETLIEQADDSIIGLSIEPIKYYLDQLPEKKNVAKGNFAVSNYDGMIVMYNVIPEDIIKYELPWWVKGCNSVNDYHPTVYNLLKQLGYIPEKIIQKNLIKVKRFQSIVDEYGIKKINKLKIDTEGHDCIILQDYLSVCIRNPDLFADEVMFESNELSNDSDVNHMIDEFTKYGYTLTYRSRETILTKNK